MKALIRNKTTNIIAIVFFAVIIIVLFSSNRKTDELKKADQYWNNHEYIRATEIYSQFSQVDLKSADRINQYLEMVNSLFINKEIITENPTVDGMTYDTERFSKEKIYFETQWYDTKKNLKKLNYEYTYTIVYDVENKFPIIKYDVSNHNSFETYNGYVINLANENGQLKLISIIPFHVNDASGQKEWFDEVYFD